MISLITHITELNQNLDEDAQKRVGTIKGALVRKNDEMEVAETSMTRGAVFLDAYLGLLTENGLNLKEYSTKVVQQPKSERKSTYKLILTKR